MSKVRKVLREKISKLAMRKLARQGGINGGIKKVNGIKYNNSKNLASSRSSTNTISSSRFVGSDSKIRANTTASGLFLVVRRPRYCYD